MLLVKERGFVRTGRARAAGVYFKRVRSLPLASKLLSAVGTAVDIRKGKYLLLL